MGSASGRRRRLIVLSLLGAAVLTLSIFSVAGFAFGYTEEWEERFQLEPGEALRVQGVNGSITYETWPGDQVVIQATKRVRGPLPALARRYAQRVEVRMTRDEQGVSVRTLVPRWYGFGGWNTRISLVVRVPEGWSGTTWLQTSNGRIRATDLHGRATIRTSNGPVWVSRHSGELEVWTSNGSVELSQVDSVLQVRSSNGPIRIEGGYLRESGSLQTSNGSVYLRTQLDPHAHYRVGTSNGPIDLTLIEPDVALELQTTNGTIELDTPVLTSVTGRNRLVGQIGSGAARLTATTTNGNITLSATP